MQWLGFFILLEKGLELLLRLFALILFLLEGIDMLAYLSSAFFPLFLFNTFSKLFLQGLFLMLATFNQSFLLLHAFLEAFQVFVDFFDSFATTSTAIFLIRDLLIKIIDAKLHF